VHWLVDVIGGSLLGAGVAFVDFAAAQLCAPATAHRSASEE